MSTDFLSYEGNGKTRLITNSRIERKLTLLRCKMDLTFCKQRKCLQMQVKWEIVDKEWKRLED